MRRELDIHGLRSQVRTGDRLQELRRQAGLPTDAFSRRPRLTVEFAVDARWRRGRPRPGGSKAI